MVLSVIFPFLKWLPAAIGTMLVRPLFIFFEAIEASADGNCKLDNPTPCYPIVRLWI